MIDDPRSDEDLVSAYLKGDRAALEILLNRYSTIILSYLFGISFFSKDKPYLDDIRQEVLIKVFNEIRQGKFTPVGPGSFKRWVFKIAYFECLNQDKARRKGPKLTSEIFTEEPTGIPDDLVFEVTPRTQDYDNAEVKLEGILSKLSDEEQKLMRLVSEGKPYKEIQQDPLFSKYSVDYLMLKVHNLRKRIRGKEDK